MFCEKCGKQTEGDQKICASCSAQNSNMNGEENKTPEIMPKITPLQAIQAIEQSEGSKSVGKIIAIFVVLALLGIGIYGIINENFIAKDGENVSSSDLREVEFNEEEIRVLLNQAYGYVAEGQYDQAIDSYNEALDLTKVDSFYYHLISGEIAIAENDPDAAILSFNKAYELDPNDFQLNNTLNLFYLDLDQIAPQYVNYQKALSYAKRAYESETVKSETSKQNLATAYYFNDDFDQTIALLSTSDFVEYPISAYWLGLAYLSKEDEISARTYLKKAIDGGLELSQDLYDFAMSN